MEMGSEIFEKLPSSPPLLFAAKKYKYLLLSSIEDLSTGGHKFVI